MFENTKNRIWMVLCLVAMFAVASCASGSPLGLEDEAEKNLDYQSEVVEPVVIEAPGVTKGSSDWIDPGVHEAIMDMVFNLKHHDMDSGVNVIDPLSYLASSDNVVDEATSVYLQAGDGNVSFVTYGFRSFPEDEDISKIVVRGFSDAPLFNPGQGVYIGISEGDTESTKWFGPFGTMPEYVINLWNMDTINDIGRSYLTIAVYGGDTYTVEELEVTVGNPFTLPDFDWMEFDIRDYLDPEGFIREGELGPPIPPLPGEIGFEM